MVQTVEQFCAEIEKHQLVSSAEMTDLRSRWFKPDRQDVHDLDHFTQWLVSNRFLTEFVVKVVRNGKAEQLLMNQFKIRDQLATGPFQGAYLASDPLNRPVLLGVLAESKAQDSAALADFQQTAKKAIAVDHANVLRTLDVGTAAGLHYLVKEYFEGETLRSVLSRRGTLPYPQATRIFALALAGLQALHEKNVSAGALTPECILLTAIRTKSGKQHTVKLLQTGVKRKVFDTSAVGKADVLGIPDDIKLADQIDLAEVIERPSSVADDLFNLGCSFYECLTGSAPYSPDQLPRPGKAAKSVGDLLPDLPDMLVLTIDQMIDPDPKERPEQAAHVAKSLRIILATEQEMKDRKAEENIVAPVAQATPDYAEDDSEEELEAEGVQGKAVALWDEIKPTNREWIFLGLGALAVIVIAIFVRLFVGLKFDNVVFLLTGGALAFFAERYIRWQERRTEEV